MKQLLIGVLVYASLTTWGAASERFDMSGWVYYPLGLTLGLGMFALMDLYTRVSK